MAPVAVLLAGGGSTRMGRDKAGLEIDGETLVERHLRQLRGAGVTDPVVVCNAANHEVIRRRTGARTLLQIGDGMSAAVRTGLQAAGPTGTVWLVCINDIIGDADYAKIADAAAGDGIVIPTKVLDRVFHGGHLLLDGDQVRAIVEKPPGGCRPGAHANIMVHRVSGGRAIEALAAATDYEGAVNELIDAGVAVRAAPVDFWIAVKTPEDFKRLGELRSPGR
jgi:CTP:molybdopterin cytidylyltransferase MocA